MTRLPTLAERQQAAAHATEGLLALPYAPGFAEALAYQFASLAAEQVPAVLDTHFPQPDPIDCAYLAAVLSEIDATRTCERTVGCGTEFVFWGIEYQARNMARARQWLAAAEAALG